MKKATWFSRHTPTPAQVAEAKSMGYTLVDIDEGKRIGAFKILDNGDVRSVCTLLLGTASESGASAVFGVFPVPLQGQLARTAQDAVQSGEWQGVVCYASWNVNRAPEGEKPTFEHAGWVCVGRLSQHSLRWL